MVKRVGKLYFNRNILSSKGAVQQTFTAEVSDSTEQPIAQQ